MDQHVYVICVRGNRSYLTPSQGLASEGQCRQQGLSQLQPQLPLPNVLLPSGSPWQGAKGDGVAQTFCYRRPNSQAGVDKWSHQ